MLDTRTPTLSTRTRRLDAAPRPLGDRSESGARASSRARTAAYGNAVEAPRPDVSPAPRSRRRAGRAGRSEMRLMGAATACTAVVCGLLLLYLAAYAHVTRLGIDQAQARVRLRQTQLRNEMLRAQCDGLQSPQRILTAAQAQGMTPRGSVPINYIPNILSAQGQQGTNRGTSETTASRNH